MNEQMKETVEALANQCLKLIAEASAFVKIDDTPVNVVWLAKRVANKMKAIADSGEEPNSGKEQ